MAGTREAHGTAPAASGPRAPLRARVRRSVEAHLGSPDVAHIIYGSVIGLALVEALSKHPPPSGAVAATLFGSAIAVGLAEAYSELVAADARAHRPADRPPASASGSWPASPPPSSSARGSRRPSSCSRPPASSPPRPPSPWRSGPGSG